MTLHHISLPCDLALLSPSHRDATMSSPCCTPHFMTQRRLMFSNPAQSEPHLSPAGTMSDDTLSALTLPLHCISISRSTTPPQVVAVESTPICLNHFTFAESQKPDL